MPEGRVPARLVALVGSWSMESEAMKTRSLVMLLVGCLLGTATMSFAQSLGEYARKERAKEASQPKATKVYTNENIPHSTTLAEPAPSSPQAPANTSEPEAENAKTPGGSEASEAKLTPQPGQQPEDKVKTKEYWQAKFADAKAKLDRADEEFKLSEDELNLEQRDQARELDPQMKARMDQDINNKRAAVESKREAYEKARQALGEVKKEFAASGAPSDWLPADEKQ
jgi:hypothetical protein